MINKFLSLWRKKRASFVPKYTFRGGVTLIEMIVVTGIIALLSTITLINHQAFNSTIVLTSLAYDVALSIREAQVFGLAVRQESESESFDTGYGVHFGGALSNTTFLLFADTDTDFLYDEGEKILRKFTIGRGASISDFCATPISSPSSPRCKLDNDITFLDISFQRPNPEAYFRTNLSEEYSSARIVVQSSQGVTREIEILLTGQIEVL